MCLPYHGKSESREEYLFSPKTKPSGSLLSSPQSETALFSSPSTATAESLHVSSQQQRYDKCREETKKLAAVLISQRVYSVIEELVEVVAFDPLRLKGFSQLAIAYALLGLYERSE